MVFDGLLLDVSSVEPNYMDDYPSPDSNHRFGCKSLSIELEQLLGFLSASGDTTIFNSKSPLIILFSEFDHGENKYLRKVSDD